MKAVVTGANGFVGSNLVGRLLAEGWDVTALVRAGCDLRFLEGTAASVDESGLDDTEALRRIFDGADVVFHCASRASDWGSMEMFKAANIDNTVRVTRAAAGAGVGRLLYVGSTVVYGFGGHIDTDETAPKKPNHFPYCISKLEAEWQVEEIARDEKLDYTIIRPGNVFGPNDRVMTVHLYGFLQKGRYAHIDGGRTLTCPTYVENLVDAMILAATRAEASREDFIITDGLRITWREYIDIACKALGVRPPKMSFPSGPVYYLAALAEGAYKAAGAKSPPLITRYRIAQVSRDYHFSIDKARRILGFEPRTSIEDALARTARWFQSI